MAKNPGNGNFDQGYLGKQGSERASVPPESMWTKPVARITPAAKALAATKRLPSVRRNLRCLPMSGIAMPATPASRIEAMAMSFNFNAAGSSRQISSSEDWQLVLLIESDIVCKRDSEKSLDPRRSRQSSDQISSINNMGRENPKQSRWPVKTSKICMCVKEKKTKGKGKGTEKGFPFSLC